MKKKIGNGKWYIVAFLVSFLPRLWLCCQDPTQMRLIPDEIGKLASTAYLAGLDWGPVVSTTKYYGIGYYMFFAPILAFVDNFVLFNFILRVGAALVCSAVALIALYVMKHYLKETDELYACGVAVICSYCLAGGIRNISNEYMLNLISWLCVWLLLRLNELGEDKKKQRIILTVVLAVCLLYSLLVHTRSLVFCGGVAFIAIVYRLVYRRPLVYLPVFLPCLGLGYFGMRKLEKLITKVLWQSDGEVVVKNTSDNLSSMLGRGFGNLFSYDSLRAIVKILVGNVYTIIYFTGCTIFIALVFACVSIYRHIKKDEICKDVVYRGKNLIFWLFCCCVAAVLGGICLVWYPQVSKAILGINPSKYNYNYKAVVYTRYYANYLGPVLMISLLYFKEHVKAVLSKWYVGAVALVFLVWFWLTHIVTYLLAYVPCVREFMPITFRQYIGQEVFLKDYVPAAIFVFVMLALLVLSGWRRKQLVYVAVVMVFLIYSRCYYDIQVATNKYPQVEAGVQYVRKLAKEQDIPRTIYVKNQSASYAYQALLSRYTVIPRVPEEELDRAIVITNNMKEEEKLVGMGYHLVILNENTYVWLKGLAE